MNKDTPIYMVVGALWILIFHESLKAFGFIQMYLAYCGYLILFSALLFEIYFKYVRYVNSYYRKWIVLIFIFFIFSLVNGIIKGHTLQFMSRDVWPYSYFSCLFLAARKDIFYKIDKMIFYQFIYGIIVFIILLFSSELEGFTRNSYDATGIPEGSFNVYIAWGLLYGWMYMFITDGDNQPKTRRFITIVGCIFYVGFGLFMLKRQVIFELIILLFLKSIFKLDKKNVFNRLILLTLLTVLPIMFFDLISVDLIEKFYERLSGEGDILTTILNNPRISEHPTNIYNQALASEVLYGQGLGSSVLKDGVVDTVVESGFFTTFLKGGVVLILIWYFTFFKILKDFIRNQHLERFRTELGILCIIFITNSIFAPFFIDHFTTGYKMLWVGYLISKGRENG